MEALLVLALMTVAILLTALVRRRSLERRREAGSAGMDAAATQGARAAKLAADQAIIARSGGQGMNQGGFGGGMG